MVEAFNQGWLKSWIKKDFKGKKNKDLWLQLWALTGEQKVTFRWIKGHAGHPENERCHQLAEGVARGGPHLVDNVYEETARIGT